MSLEKLLADLTAAIEENTAALKVNAASRDEALEMAKNIEGGKASSGGRGRGRSADKDKAADAGKDDAKSSEDRGEGSGRGRGRGRSAEKDKEESKAPSADDLKAAASEFVNVKEGSKEADARFDFLESMLKELGVDKVSQIAEDDRARAINYMQRFADGESVDFAEDQAPARGRRSLVD